MAYPRRNTNRRRPDRDLSYDDNAGDLTLNTDGDLSMGIGGGLSVDLSDGSIGVQVGGFTIDSDSFD
jgi:hypothetical protein